MDFPTDPGHFFKIQPGIYLANVTILSTVKALSESFCVQQCKLHPLCVAVNTRISCDACAEYTCQLLEGLTPRFKTPMPGWKLFTLGEDLVLNVT